MQKSKTQSNKKYKNTFIVALIVLAAGGIIFGLIWYSLTRPAIPESDIVAKKGLHWHSEVSISLLGKVQDIPEGIGLGFTHKPMHTHEKDGVIHMEFSGIVFKSDLKIGKFFEIWGKRFDKNCIFDKCAGPEGKLKMLVNGKENGEFENYIMRDQDKIEIIFE